MAGADPDPGRITGLAEFHGVADQVLEQLGELDFIAHDGGQRVAFDLGLVVADRELQVIQRPVQHVVTIRDGKRFAVGAHPRIRQQVPDQRLRPLGAVRDEAEKLVRFAVELALVPHPEQFRETVDRP